MKSMLTTLQKSWKPSVFIIAAGIMGTTEAANFSYGQIQLQVGYATFDEPIVITNDDATEDQHRHLRVLGLSAAYQYPSAVFIGASTTQGEGATERSRLNSAAHSAYVGYAIGLRRKLDIYATLGAYHSEAQACNDTKCNRVNDQTLGYDFGIRAGAGHWFEWGVNLKTLPYKKLGESSTLGVHAALWMDRHASLVTNWIRNKDSYALTIGYRFSF